MNRKQHANSDSVTLLSSDSTLRVSVRFLTVVTTETETRNPTGPGCKLVFPHHLLYSCNSDLRTTSCKIDLSEEYKRVII